MTRTAVGGFGFGDEEFKRRLRNVGAALAIGGTLGVLIGLVPKKIGEAAVGAGMALLTVSRFF